MTHCAKCGAELIGSKRFCAACGTPAGDPRQAERAASSIGALADPGAPAGPTSQAAHVPPMSSQVNPFAQTATPPATSAPAYGPPPAVGSGSSLPPAMSSPAAEPVPSQVSPLAMSNLISERGAFEAAMGALGAPPSAASPTVPQAMMPGLGQPAAYPERSIGAAAPLAPATPATPTTPAAPDVAPSASGSGAAPAPSPPGLRGGPHHADSGSSAAVESKRKIPGTQLMSGADPTVLAGRAAVAAAAAAAAGAPAAPTSLPKRHDKTQAMSAAAFTGVPGAPAPISTHAPGGAPAPAGAASPALQTPYGTPLAPIAAPPASAPAYGPGPSPAFGAPAPAYGPAPGPAGSPAPAYGPLTPSPAPAFGAPAPPPNAGFGAPAPTPNAAFGVPPPAFNAGPNAPAPAFNVPPNAPAFNNAPADPQAPGFAQGAPVYGAGPVAPYPQAAPVPYGAPAYPAAPAPGPVPPPAQAWGYGGAAPVGMGMFGYAPGARVQVTWSNGLRYPGTIQQVSGTQCLIVFPDGQQHWVDMQYIAPG